MFKFLFELKFLGFVEAPDGVLIIIFNLVYFVIRYKKLTDH